MNYQNIPRLFFLAFCLLTTPGDSTYHSLLATIEKYPDPENPADTLRELVVCADGFEVYRAVSPGLTHSFEHRAGYRFDNGKFDIGFLTNPN